VKLHEIDPEKRYVLTVEADGITQQDLEKCREQFRERGLDNITITAGPITASDPPRYWGIWVAPPSAKPGWMRNGQGEIFHYPHPAIAEVHMLDIGWKHCEVKEFRLNSEIDDIMDNKILYK